MRYLCNIIKANYYTAPIDILGISIFRTITFSFNSCMICILYTNVSKSKIWELSYMKKLNQSRTYQWKNPWWLRGKKTGQVHVWDLCVLEKNTDIRIKKTKCTLISFLQQWVIPSYGIELNIVFKLIFNELFYIIESLIFTWVKIQKNNNNKNNHNTWSHPTVIDDSSSDQVLWLFLLSLFFLIFTQVKISDSII